mgnify:CR=1 FL=1
MSGFSTIQLNHIVYVMNEGQWVEFGTHTELMNRYNIYYSMLSQNTSEQQK